MKKIYKSIIAAAVFTPLLTSCVEEVFPTSGVTEEQLSSSSKALEAKVWGMAGILNRMPFVTSSWHFDWGYGSMMHARDVMTEQYAVMSSNYDWYTSWAEDQAMGADYAYAQVMWATYMTSILTTNEMLGSIPADTDDELMYPYLAYAYAYRAMLYLDMARMYEYLPTDVTSPIAENGENLVNMTIPIVTEKTTEEQARNNPRVPRQKMFEFILSDLENAEKYGDYMAPANKTLPDLACVYGLYARLYMWVENYPKAAEYAKMAYTQHGGVSTITTESEWLNTATGFNTLATSSWMWGAKLESENAAVQSGILNWTSWVCNETTYGYASAGPFVMINAATYDRIGTNDFRKLSYLAPEGGSLYGKSPVVSESLAASLPEYSSLKFRPGDGNPEDYNVGSATAYPLMRVEEMYLIEAEAVAHSNAAEGLNLLKAFMKYRNPTYTTFASTEDEVVEEVYFQKSVELWGEGQTFFDTKRLDYSVTRGYQGTNFGSQSQLNTNGRPAWMNLVIPLGEVSNNPALDGFNNPDPSYLY